VPFADYENRIKTLKELSVQSWGNYASLIHIIKKFSEGKADEMEVFYWFILCEIDFNSIGNFFEK